MEQKVTTIEEMLEYQKGQFVQLPDFAEGMPFFARLRRPSLLVLAKNGHIPNTLITTANRLFAGKGIDDQDTSAMADVWGVLDAMCEATFVEPSYEEIKAAGITLTDQQMLAVFNYAQEGTRALEPFRTKSQSESNSSNAPKVQKTSIRATKNKG